MTIHSDFSEARQSAGKTNDDYFFDFVEGRGIFLYRNIPSKETKGG